MPLKNSVGVEVQTANQTGCGGQGGIVGQKACSAVQGQSGKIIAFGQGVYLPLICRGQEQQFLALIYGRTRLDGPAHIHAAIVRIEKQSSLAAVIDSSNRGYKAVLVMYV